MGDLLGSALIQLRSALRLAERDGSDLVSVPLSKAEIKSLLAQLREGRKAA